MTTLAPEHPRLTTDEVPALPCPWPLRARWVAHQRIANAKRTGKLLAAPCSWCGNTKVVAHHDDYDKPLDVTWLCHLHHRARHVQLGWGYGHVRIGEELSMAKLNAEKVIEIRALFEQGYRKSKLADRFGVSHRLITFVLRRELWRHVK